MHGPRKCLKMTIAIPLLLLLASPPIEGRRAAPDIDALELTAEMTAFLDENVDQHLPEYDRLNRLVAAIFTDSLLGFEYDRSRTKTAAETFEERSGNCLSFSNLLVTMGRQIGLEAHFQEVDTPPTWDRHGKIVVAAHHVNVVVFIGARVYEVDLAPEVARVRMGARVISDARGRAHFYSNRGVDFFGLGSPATAKQYFQRALAEDDEVSFAWANLGAVQSLMGQHEEAESSNRIALR